MADTSIEIDEKEERYLLTYLYHYGRNEEQRQDENLYQTLVENVDGKWSWASSHDWETWRDHYLENKDRIDRAIAARLAKDTQPKTRRIVPNTPKVKKAIPYLAPTPGQRLNRTLFSPEDDEHIVQYLAIEKFDNKGRQGSKIWAALVADAEGMWPWAARHSQQSWRERYKKRTEVFDSQIDRFQRKHKIREEHTVTDAARHATWRRFGVEPSRGHRRESGQSEKAKGKRRAVDDEPDSRPHKRKRTDVGPMSVQAADRAPRLAPRALSVAAIAVLQEEKGDESEQEGEDSEDEVDELCETDVPASPPVKIKRRKRAQPEPTSQREEEGANRATTPPRVRELPQDEVAAEPYPVTSTPRKGVSIKLSEAIPTPKSMKAPMPPLRATLRNGKAAQEPTPPTSDSLVSPPRPSKQAIVVPVSSVVDYAVNASGECARDENESADELLEFPQNTPSPVQKATKRKRVVRPHGHDSDPFESDDDAASSPSQLRPIRRAPETSARAMKGSKFPIKVTRRVADADGGALVGNEEEATERGLDQRPSPSARAGPQAGPSSPAVAPASQGSRRTHHPFSQPTQAGEETHSPAAEHHPFSDVEESQTQRPRVQPVGMARKLLGAFRLWGSGENLRHPVKAGPSTAHRVSDPILSLPAAPQPAEPSNATTSESSLRLNADLLPPYPPSTKGKEKATEMPSPEAIPNRRHTLATLPPFLPIAQPRKPRSSLAAETSFASAPPSIAPPAPMKLSYGDVVLDPRDHPAVYKTMLKQAVKKTGWPKDIVHGVWRTTGSWTATIEVLNAERVREATGQAIIEEMEEQSRILSSTSRQESVVEVDDDEALGNRLKESAIPREAQEYTPPDDSRAAIYLREHGMLTTPEEPEESETTWGDGDVDDSIGQVTGLLKGINGSRRTDSPPSPHIAAAKRILSMRNRR